MWVWPQRGEGAKFKTAKISSKTVASNSAKFCTSINFPLYSIIVPVAMYLRLHEFDEFLNILPGDREGDDRGGPRGRGRERDGESKDSRRQPTGNAWSKGRPRILSNDGPKKYEEPQIPVSS
jgi:hypothetical protein